MSGIIVRTGIDLVSIDQLSTMVQDSGSTFTESVWTERERLYCAGNVERLASRWAAKEATMKALGEGISQIELTDIEVEAKQGEPPRLALNGRALELSRAIGVTSWSLSLAHDAGVAVAVVVGVGEVGGNNDPGR